MNSGRMTERVAIQTPTRVADGIGGFTVVWNTVNTVWATVEPLKGREQLQAMQLEASNLFRLVVRNDVSISPDQRLLWTGIVLNIREAPITPRHQLFRTIIAEAGVAS